MRIRTGDVVRHRRTGEQCVVAYADYSRDKLAPRGQPEVCIREFELLRAADDNESMEVLADLAVAGDSAADRAQAIARAGGAL